MQTLIKNLDPAVRDAVIHKYLRYMDQIFISKCMLYRKSLMRNGFPSMQHYQIYKMCIASSLSTKMKLI